MPPASCSPPWRSWGPKINADESALWLSEIIPAPLEFRYVDKRRLGLASLADAQSLALTTTFSTIDTGLQSQDDGTANRVWELARDAGILLTQAGSAFPYGQDDNDRNIRLAPTLPPQEEVEAAMDGVATCVLLAAVEKLGA